MISLMAATAMGEPPRVPSVDMDATSISRSLSLLSAALTKPTGTPITSAGTADFVSMISQRVRRAEGAFPITTMEPLSLSFKASTPAEVRVMPCSAARESPLPKKASTGLLCPFFKTPASTIFMSTNMGSALSRAVMPAWNGSPLKRSSPATLGSPVAMTHLCLMRSSGLSSPIKSEIKRRLFLLICMASGVVAPISV
jgi:hypothetical protein